MVIFNLVYPVQLEVHYQNFIINSSSNGLCLSMLTGNWKRSGIHVFNITNVECLRCVFVFVDVQHNIHIVQYKHTSQTLCVCYR